MYIIGGGGEHKRGKPPPDGVGFQKKSHHTYELHKVRRRRDAFPHFAPHRALGTIFWLGVLSWADKQKKKKKKKKRSSPATRGAVGVPSKQKKNNKNKRSLLPTRGAELSWQAKKKRSSATTSSHQGSWVAAVFSEVFCPPYGCVSAVLPLSRKFPFWGEI